MHLYVYYDVPDAVENEVHRKLAALRERLQPHRFRLMRRVDGKATWMEVHESVDAGVEARLATAIDDLGIAALTGPRHVERFIEVDEPDRA